MLVFSLEFNVEVVCQVVYLISVYKVLVEDDYFIVVDDLNDGKIDIGLVYIGEVNFVVVLFYSYICINKIQLVENFGGNVFLVDNVIKVLIEVVVKVFFKGK